MSYPGKMLEDSLCDPAAITMAARQLMGTICVAGGADCPLFASRADALAILERVKSDPSVTIRLTSDADRLPHYSMLTDEDYANLDRDGVFHRKRDLDVLQRLGLTPGDTRRSRYLYELLLQRIETPDGICAYNTPGWEGCPLARGGFYELARSNGSRNLVFDRVAGEKAEARKSSIARIRNDPVLRIRPHHLMCMSCWYGAGQVCSPRSDDTLDVLWERISTDPDLEIMLVEGNCEACHCCDGFHPASTRCVHACGLIRDYKKDLDIFQKLGLLPGARMNARKLLGRIFQCIPSTREVCGYGTGVVTGQEWKICGGPEGNTGYRLARESIPPLLSTAG